MAIITFEALHAEVAAWHAREAAEQLPLARACRALDTLREALPLLSACERDVVRAMAGEMVGGSLLTWLVVSVLATSTPARTRRRADTAVTTTVEAIWSARSAMGGSRMPL